MWSGEEGLKRAWGKIKWVSPLKVGAGSRLPLVIWVLGSVNEGRSVHYLDRVRFLAVSKLVCWYRRSIADTLFWSSYYFGTSIKVAAEVHRPEPSRAEAFNYFSQLLVRFTGFSTGGI